MKAVLLHYFLKHTLYFFTLLHVSYNKKYFKTTYYKNGNVHIKFKMIYNFRFGEKGQVHSGEETREELGSSIIS